MSEQLSEQDTYKLNEWAATALAELMEIDQKTAKAREQLALETARPQVAGLLEQIEKLQLDEQLDYASAVERILAEDPDLYDKYRSVVLNPISE